MSALAISHQPSSVRGAVLMAAFGLLLFLGFFVAIRMLGWAEFPLLPLVPTVGALAFFNLLLAVDTRWRDLGAWVAWAYEGIHAAAFTAMFHFFGGISAGVFMPVYGFLVVHTEILRPDASPFVTANICLACYALLAVTERLGFAPHRGDFALPATPGVEATLLSFAAVSFNFLALYASRHGQALRALADNLERRVAERAGDLVRANRELERSAAALEAKQHELQTLVYSVTHDLKNPLNAILLVTDLVLEREGERLTAEGRADLQRVACTAEAAETMLRDLLGFFRTTSTLEPARTVPLAPLVAQALETLAPLITAKGVRVVVGELPSVWGQERKLGCLIENLLDNAVKYVSAELGEVSVTAARENGHVLLRVRDNGVGVPKPYQQGIFELFGRVPDDEQPGGSSAAGSGVGLAIVRRVAEAHQGTVWVESAPGDGSCFHVQLPAADRDGEP